MNLPIEPSKNDCCNSGCNPCVFDVYETQLKLYEKNKNNNTFYISENGISELKYTKFSVIDIINICDTHKIIKFKKLSEISDYHKVWWKPGYHFLLKYTEANTVLTRAYTPVKLKLGNEDYDFLIVVKIYNGGLVSNYLFNLAIGEETLWRGPYGSYSIEPNKYNKIVIIAQGTGIAPFISIILNILNNEEDMTKLVLFYCCNDISSILFRDILLDFNTYWNFSYKIFVSCKSTDFAQNVKYNEPLINRKLDISDLAQFKSVSFDQYLLCGSSEFMKYYEEFLVQNNFSKNIFLF